jgi:hypothetical protein
MSASHAPIVFFAYKRADHARTTLEALRRNPEAAHSDLHVFIDGPRSPSDERVVGEVRGLIRGVSGFRSVHVVERQENLGLSRSIITGVGEVVRETGRVIVIEDDIVTAPEFLHYMNAALDKYERRPMIQSISGFNIPQAKFRVADDYEFDVYCNPRPSVWGWATWRDRWERVDWSDAGVERCLSSPSERRAFDEGGRGLAGMLAGEHAGRIQGWDVRWAFDHFVNHTLAITPVRSYVRNIGMDGTGTNCAAGSRFDDDISGAIKSPRLMPQPYVDPKLMNEFRRFFERKPTLPREINRIARQLGLKEPFN